MAISPANNVSVNNKTFFDMSALLTVGFFCTFGEFRVALISICNLVIVYVLVLFMN